MTDIIEKLNEYLNNPSEVMSPALVKEVIAELAAERERVKLLEAALENDDGSLGSSRVAKLLKALEFYADPKCEWVPDFYSELDFGSVARDVLAETGGDNGNR